MKIRIKDNSIRFRLAQDEVSALVKTGETWSTCSFPNGKLTYGIVATNSTEIYCSFADEKITTYVPKSLLTNWDTDERVGFDANTDNLFILIEKDWQCLKPRANEDESDLYVNPQA